MLSTNQLIKSDLIIPQFTIINVVYFIIIILNINLKKNLIYCSGSLLPVVNHNNSYSSSLVKSSLGFPMMQLNDDHHICTKEENYTEIIQVPVQQPVRIRTQTWCFEVPPRCSNYRTEIREVIKVENITRTRTIRFCCEGYAGVLSANETVCKPICRGGCGRGYCRSPDICKCDLGYIGKHCTQRCPHDRWGEDCSNECHCRNGGVCDNKNGACRCSSGWIGETCEQTCAPGFYGYMCKKLCECSSERCNPQTGECISKESNDNSLKKNLQTIKAASDLLSDSIKSQSKEIDQSTTNTRQSILTTEQMIIKQKDIEKDTFQRTYIEFGIPRISAMDFTTEETMAELILYKQDTSADNSNFDTNPNHISPVVVTNIPTELEEDELTRLNPRVIHVIDWQQQHHSNSDNNITFIPNDDDLDFTKTFEKSYSGVITSLALFIIVLTVSGIAFLIFHKRQNNNVNNSTYLSKNSNTGSSTMVATNAENFKTFIQPLPDLPAFTQNLRKANEDGMLCFYVVPEFYDSPTNNSAVVKSTYTTTYGTPGPLYSSVGPKLHRKESLENHLYDEIRYPTVKSCRV